VRQRLFVSLCGGTSVVVITLAAAASPRDSKANNISLRRNNTVAVLVVTQSVLDGYRMMYAKVDIVEDAESTP
jgi:hypothetical protein